MGQIENMQPEDVEFLKKQIDELNQGRTEPMIFKTFPMEDLEFSKRLSALEEKVDRILTRIEHIFGPYVLIKGRFEEIKIPGVPKER